MKKALVILLGVLLSPLAPAQSASKSPLLRPDPGMHTAAIGRIATEDTGRLILTCSNDKTAKLWRLNHDAGLDGPAQEHLRTLRPPIGPGEQGKLFACALSSDGSLAAVGGWTAGKNEKESVYLFDTSSGRMLCQVPGLPNVVTDLSFSPSGEFLAVAMAEGGLRIYEISKVFHLSLGYEWARDDSYEAECYGIAWQSDGRQEWCATSCYDGWVRLYRIGQEPPRRAGQREPFNRLNPVTKVLAIEGARPFSLAFSPDGEFLAVGFSDRPAVCVLDGKSLEVQYFPKTATIKNGDLGIVSWIAPASPKGSFSLAAGGSWHNDTGKVLFRIWSDAGTGTSSDVEVAGDGIEDAITLPGGGLLWASGEPSWGRVQWSQKTASGRPGWQSDTLATSPIADFRGAGPYFGLNADASVVEFTYGYAEKTVYRFDLMERHLDDMSGPGASLDKGIHLPLHESLAVSGWLNTPNPALNDRPLPIAENDVSRSLAIAPGGTHFVLGTEWSLRCFGRDGRPVWELPAPGPVYALNLSDDGSLAVAAYGDGTIRWHEVDRGGNVLMVLFPHADRKRYMLWNASGYYDCSPNAEDLLGWHLDSGPGREAGFVPASKFRDRFYRPDVLSQLLATRDLPIALRQANEVLGRRETPAEKSVINLENSQPPVVEISVGGALGEVEVGPNASSVSVTYRVRSPNSASVKKMRMLIDGRPVSMEVPIPDLSKSGSEARLDVPLPQGLGCTVGLLAENEHATSEPALLMVKRSAPQMPVEPKPLDPKPVQPNLVPEPKPVPAPAPALDPTPPREPSPIMANSLKPSLYLLAIGVSDYLENEYLPDLGYAAIDARDFAAAFQKQEGGLYQKVSVKLLDDAQATSGNILDGLEWIKKETTSKDVAVIFVAGHGENDEELRYFFCPHDYDHKRRMRTGVSMEDIQITVSGIAGKVLLFVDTCHAGNAVGSMAKAKRGAAQGVDITGMVNELSSSENGAVVFASCTGRQQSMEDATWKNGAFTEAVLEGLGGKADLLGNGKITVSTLEAFVAERVKALTEGEQTPTVAKPQTITDFPIAVKAAP